MNCKLVFMCCLLVVSAGCGTVPKGDEVDITYYGSVTRSDAGFEMIGYIASEGGVPDRDTYSDVDVQLYSKDGNLQCTKQIGDLEANSGRLNLTISTDAVPHFVVIASEDFWTEQVEVDYFEFDEERGEYKREEVTSSEEYPFEQAGPPSPSC